MENRSKGDKNTDIFSSWQNLCSIKGEKWRLELITIVYIEKEKKVDEL